MMAPGHRVATPVPDVCAIDPLNPVVITDFGVFAFQVTFKCNSKQTTSN